MLDIISVSCLTTSGASHDRSLFAADYRIGSDLRAIDRSARRRDLPPLAATERRDLSILAADPRLRRPLRLREVELAQRRRVARVALRYDDVDRSREAAHGARLARLTRDLGRVRGRKVVVFQSARAHARRGRVERGSAALVRARRERVAGGGALPAEYATSRPSRRTRRGRPGRGERSP